MAAGCDVDVMFERFLRSCRAALRRISAHTRGEHSVSDVEGEAWLLAEELRLEKGLTPEFGCRDYQEKIISFLYQKLVRYSEVNVRCQTQLKCEPLRASARKVKLSHSTSSWRRAHARRGAAV